jgi:hypothetical protein
MHINIFCNFLSNVFTLTICFIVLNTAVEFVLIYRPHPVLYLGTRTYITVVCKISQYFLAFAVIGTEYFLIFVFPICRFDFSRLGRGGRGRGRGRGGNNGGGSGAREALDILILKQT